MIWLPTLRQLIRLHEKVIARSGGAAGIRDAGLIESALMRANASFGDYEAYSTVAEKAAAVCCGLIGNHGFVDGNKRIGVMAMLLILKKNGSAEIYAGGADPPWPGCSSGKCCRGGGCGVDRFAHHVT